MIVYNNNQAHTTYPFTVPIPFPEGLIGGIKVALKDSTQIPYISSIMCKQDYLCLNFQTDSSFLGAAIYQGNKWITIDTDKIFGFVHLNAVPKQVFNFSGKWLLHRSCYTFPIEGKDGVGTIRVNYNKVPASQILNIRLSGDISARDNNGAAVVNIGRASQGAEDYTKSQLWPEPYITTVNAIQCTEMRLKSSDSSILIQPPVKRGDTGVYVMYINTTSAFPHCSLQDSSDSLSS